MENALLLGLIGDNIGPSRAPVLHRLAGKQNGVDVRYERLVPPALGLSFEAVLPDCAQTGFRGVNVTYPYKERAARLVEIGDPLVRAMGAVNTVLFEPGGPIGHNTDYSGFLAAFRRARADVAPGRCCLVGTGGVGRALGFALVALGAREIRLVDQDRARAEALARDLANVGTTPVAVHDDIATAMRDADGLLNGTPLGMKGIGGTAFDPERLRGAQWAFDAVYTPTETPFLRDAARHGLAVLSGYELFFYQGVDAWSHFAGLPLDETRLRRALAEAESD